MRHLNYPDIPYHALLHRAASAQPDTIAIRFRDNTLSYAEWDRRASQVTNGLSALGLSKGDRVGLLLPNCPEYEIAFFGVSRLGGIPSPLNPSYKEREIAHQLRDSGASALVVHSSLYPAVAAVRAQLPELRHVIAVGDETEECVPFEPWLEAQANEAREVSLDGGDLAALPYSSGTTGLSKGVMLTQSNLVCNALQFVDATGSTEKDRLLIFVPLYHIYGVALMGTAVGAYATQLLMERFDLPTMMDLVEREGATEIFVVPPVMLAFANAPDLRSEQFQSVRFVKSAAAPLSAEVGRRVASRLAVQVIQAYGMTEASPLTHMVPLDEDGFDNVGVPVADTRCRIMDLDTGTRELQPGEIGEVTIHGPQVMAGYWQAPRETAAALRDGWLYTGDVGTTDEDGRLFIVDRKKEMIKYKAFSIAPAELEAVLLEHPAVLDCGVTGQPDPEAGEVPRAFVVLRQGETSSPAELQAFVAERVAAYKQIRVLEIVSSIPRTPSGKILRRMLKEQMV
jgi:long-chain acyl-CoA synthetase